MQRFEKDFLKKKTHYSKEKGWLSDFKLVVFLKLVLC